MFGRALCGLLVAAVVGSASLVHADETTVTVATKVTSRYVLQDLGIVASDNLGVTTDIAITKGAFTLDWWQRVDLAGGQYGNRGYGDEHDITLTGAWELGGFNVETAAAYFFVAPLDQTNAAWLEFYVDLGRTYELGHGVSITPAVRVIEYVPVSMVPAFTIVRGRLPISLAVPKLQGVSLAFDPSVIGNLTPRADQHNVLWRPTGSVVWQVSDALSLEFDAKATDRTDPEFDFGFTYRF